MLNRLNRFMDVLSNFFAHRKGLIPILAMVLILANYLLQLFPIAGWVASTNLFLHLGLILVILGMMLAWAL